MSYISYQRLFDYLKENRIKQKDFIEKSGISKTTLHRIKNNENIGTDTVTKICDALNCDLAQIMEIKSDDKAILSTFQLSNRRYIGSKAKLINWIFTKIRQQATDCNSFADVFTGTGIVAQTALKYYQQVTVNDILFSNKIIYEGFWGKGEYDLSKLEAYVEQFNQLLDNELEDNYFATNYGNKYFGIQDARVVGHIRDLLEQDLKNQQINEREFAILLTSLVYSTDRIANTVGHFETYCKGKIKDRRFEFRLIQLPTGLSNEIAIYQQSANDLVRHIRADIMFLDPPYNSRQYSRFYHVLENLVVWDKPELFGVALKPKESNMSDYCRTAAPKVFDDLVSHLDCKYIVVTYNNTYKSKSKSSQNKITFEEILTSLNKRGHTTVFDISHSFFNAGKTEFDDHKEFLFITKVNSND